MSHPESIELFDVVATVETERTVALEVAGAMGAVLGISEPDVISEAAAYAVSIDGLDRTVMLVAAELRPTGERRTLEDFYDGTSIQVSKRGEVLGSGPESV